MKNAIALLILLATVVLAQVDTTYKDGMGCGGCLRVEKEFVLRLRPLPLYYQPDDGKESEVAIDRDGKENGIERWYYVSGKLLRSVRVYNGEAVGGDTVYYNNGVISAVAEFNSNKGGMFKGLSGLKQYYRSGAIQEESTYLGGKRHGETIYYQKDGKFSYPEYTTAYEYDVILRSSAFYKNGAIRWEYNCRNGKKEGTVIQYFPSGKQAGTATYKDGKLLGYVQCTDGRKGNGYLDCTKQKSNKGVK